MRIKSFYSWLGSNCALPLALVVSAHPCYSVVKVLHSLASIVYPLFVEVCRRRVVDVLVAYAIYFSEVGPFTLGVTADWVGWE